MIDAGVVEAPAAASTLSGDFEGYIGGLSLTDANEIYSFTGYLLGGAARVNAWLSDEVSAQFDLSGEALNGGDPDGESSDYATMEAAAHINWRTSDLLLGVFGSVGALSDSDDVVFGDGTFATIGGEAMSTMDNIQLYGQLGYSKGFGDVDDVSALYARGEVRYFVSPNMVVSGNVGVAQVSYSSDDKIGVLQWGAKAEYRFDDSPISIYAAYQGNHQSEPDEDEEWTVHAAMVGIKFSFGSDSLQDAATSGATLRDYSPLTGYEHLRYTDWE
jgi:hypothetical protein